MTRITEEGQVRVPESVRAELGLKPGDEVTFVETEAGYVIRKAVDESRFERWRGVADTDDTVNDRMAELRGTRTISTEKSSR